MKRMLFLIAVCISSCTTIPYGKKITLDAETVADKVRGGWFAQTIGCTYGGPTEFRYNGMIIPDSVDIPWYESYLADTYEQAAYLFDDVYMDLTFMEVMAAKGKDASAMDYALSYANAPYGLAHANQNGRYNVLNGIYPPESGYWKNNPHADDIDFQIESDFIGMVCPGCPNDAAEICDKVGHIMNYGDGWYGGVYMSAIYSLAYVCDDIETIVKEAIAIIPEGTKFRNCIDDVIAFHDGERTDWKACWQLIQDKYGETDLCPFGSLDPSNIDAAINAAYVVIGLLYGEGDFFKTMDISTRCGQDSDCNPASAAGILGVMKGYNAIPEEFKKGVVKIEDEIFPYTTLSLNTACETTVKLIGDATFKVQKPKPVAFEQCFEGIRSLKTIDNPVRELNDSLELEFDGNSICLTGFYRKRNPEAADDYVYQIKAYLDGELVQEYPMPCNWLTQKHDPFCQFCFESGHHTLKLVIQNPNPDFYIELWKIATYDKAE